MSWPTHFPLSHTGAHGVQRNRFARSQPGQDFDAIGPTALPVRTARSTNASLLAT